MSEYISFEETNNYTCEMSQNCPPISEDGRCGPLYDDKVCSTYYKSWAVYCNETNGWCGPSDAHRDKQASTAYDNSQLTGFCLPPLTTHLCQEWSLSFYSELECTGSEREITAGFYSHYRDHSQWRSFDMPLTISGSSAFSCAEDLGEFTLTTEVLLSLDGGNWTNPDDFVEFALGEAGYIQIIFSSGGTIDSVALDDITIHTSSMPQKPLCSDCENFEHSPISVEKDDHKNFVIKFILTKPTFLVDSVVFKMTFSVETSFGERRKLEIEVPRRQLREIKSANAAVLLNLKYERSTSILRTNASEGEESDAFTGSLVSKVVVGLISFILAGLAFAYCYRKRRSVEVLQLESAY
jgi:hypothetical protein